jgi:hypothetical protein
MHCGGNHWYNSFSLLSCSSLLPLGLHLGSARLGSNIFWLRLKKNTQFRRFTAQLLQLKLQLTALDLLFSICYCDQDIYSLLMLHGVSNKVNTKSVNT